LRGFAAQAVYVILLKMREAHFQQDHTGPASQARASESGGNQKV
jgi:hypothetical protein